MDIDRIKYVLENWDRLKWTQENYTDFIEKISKFDLDRLDS